MKIKKFAVNAFQALGATAVVAGLVFSGYSTQAEQDAVKNKVDTVAFNHLSTTVFQPAHDYMKGEYTKIVSPSSSMLPMTAEHIADMEAKGTFDNPQKFQKAIIQAKANMAESERMVTEKSPNFSKAQWDQADKKEQIKCKIKSIRDDGMHMPKQIWNTGTPG